MTAFASPEVHAGIAMLRPQGPHSLVEVVDIVSHGIAYCREHDVPLLMVNVTGITDVAIPTLLDRFLMVEDWAQAAGGKVTVAVVVSTEYLHPRRFGVKVASHFGLTSDVFATEDGALAWLSQQAARPRDGPAPA